ncbi:MAG: hypothetical protein HQM16_06660 [Deltaproteobacteria bacterium]|nr:hypothetical protein [Deltaproteobacteria bacterium]
MQYQFLRIFFLMFFFLMTASVFSEVPVVKETVTIQNDSQQVINGVRIVSKFNESEDSIHQKAMIEPGKSKTYELNVWQGGEFTVRVQYRYKGADQMSRPFTVTLDTGKPITPVTLKFGGREREESESVVW